FLEAVRFIAEKNKLPVKDDNPNNPFPVEEWVKAIETRQGKVTDVANMLKLGGPFKQNVKLVGTLSEMQVAFNPADPPAARSEMPAGPKGASGSEVASIYSEIALPSFLDDKSDAGGETFMPPFPAEALADYKDDDPPIAEIMKDKMKPEVRQKYLF